MLLEISQNSQENTYTGVSFLIKLQLKNSGTGVFCEFQEISKNTFFTEHTWVTASIYTNEYSYFSAHTFGRGRFRDMFSSHRFTFTSSLQIDVAALYFLTQYKHVSLHVSDEIYCRSSHWRSSIKNVFLKISQYSHDNTCVGVSF